MTVITISYRYCTVLYCSVKTITVLGGYLYFRGRQQVQKTQTNKQTNKHNQTNKKKSNQQEQEQQTKYTANYRLPTTYQLPHKKLLVIYHPSKLNHTQYPHDVCADQLPTVPTTKLQQSDADTCKKYISCNSDTITNTNQYQ